MARALLVAPYHGFLLFHALSLSLPSFYLHSLLSDWSLCSWSGHCSHVSRFMGSTSQYSLWHAGSSITIIGFSTWRDRGNNNVILFTALLSQSVYTPLPCLPTTALFLLSSSTIPSHCPSLFVSSPSALPLLGCAGCEARSVHSAMACRSSDGFLISSCPKPSGLRGT